jgi:PAS domain S-box-containing protein
MISTRSTSGFRLKPYSPRWLRVVEGLLTMFIIMIFCLSAGQVVVLVSKDMAYMRHAVDAQETGRTRRMLINRTASDYEMVLFGYYIGSAPLSQQGVQTAESYLLNVMDSALAEHHGGNNPAILKRKDEILDVVKDLRRYGAMPRPLAAENAMTFIDDINRLRISIRNLMDDMRGLPAVYGESRIQIRFLISSVASMVVSGLGLIALLLMKLRMSERLYADRKSLSAQLEPRMAAIEAAMDGVAITDSQGRLRYVNKALTDYHGYAAPEMLTHLHWKTLYDAEQQKWFDEEVMPNLLHEGHWRGHCQGLRLDGTHFHQDCAITALDDGGYVFVVRDYTELLDSIVLSNRRLAAIEAAGDGIGIVDRNGRLTYINKAMQTLHGLEEGDVAEYIGQEWSKIYTQKGRDDINSGVLPALRASGYWHGEAPILRKDGQVLIAEMTLSVLPDGGFIGTARDVTARKRSEREKEELQRQFYQSQKMEAIGRMAGGIAHDFNNILSSILGYAEFLIDDLDKTTPQHGFAKQIYNGGTQARKLVDQILAFSRRREGSVTAVSMTDCIRNTADMLKPVMPASVRLTVLGDGSDNIIRANVTQIGQALMNLCVNAIDAMDDKLGAELRIESESIMAGDDNVSAAMLARDLPRADDEPVLLVVQEDDHTSVLMSGTIQRDRHYVCVSISDNGSGMTREVMEHIFEPFFTTKSIDRGTGLGLAAVHGIVAGHRGAMTVRSRIGEGTSFTLYFPQSDDDSEAVAARRGGAVVGGNGRILVVDDQFDVAAIACEMLARLGYEAENVDSAGAAIDRLREHPGHYDLVLTDYSMPEMSGAELAETVREDFPDMPVVIMTGYGRKKLEKEIRENPSIVTVIRKPLDRVILSQVISAAIRKVRAA